MDNNKIKKGITFIDEEGKIHQLKEGGGDAIQRAVNKIEGVPEPTTSKPLLPYEIIKGENSLKLNFKVNSNNFDVLVFDKKVS